MPMPMPSTFETERRGSAMETIITIGILTELLLLPRGHEAKSGVKRLVHVRLSVYRSVYLSTNVTL